ncbi:hypothetical protein ML462_15770 [Gramella lutea]|uniref:Uncharacterized protein n=1 Tax=Christiangramia lutea TaxID=1607951 RepID=A0A9X1V576_9FLAO|nr:hypothetical protein [Christiangramia lutea]MCH4824632.1 hypothetical protein [Christiangramia lutea]
MKLKLISTIFILIILESCGASKTDLIKERVEKTYLYTQYTADPNNTDFEIKQISKTENNNGSEYCLFFKDKANDLVRTKFRTDLKDQNIVVNYYFKNDELIYLLYEDKNLDKSYSRYFENEKVIFDCCKNFQPNEAIISKGINYTKNYKSASM